MDIVRTFDDAVSFFAAYPTWVKLFGTGWFVVGVVWVATLVLTPKVEPVERWLLASDEATIKSFVPGDLFQDWKTKNEIANDLIRQRERRAADQLGVGENPPASPSTLDSTFLLKVQKAENDRNASQHRIEEYIRLNLLVAGTLLAKGIPHEARPDENKPTNIRPAQWQNLRFSIDGRALDEKGETVYKALEIGKAKGL